MRPLTSAGRGSKRACDKLGITRAMLGVDRWDDREAIKRAQAVLVGYTAGIDGWFGKKSCAAFSDMHARKAIVDHQVRAAPGGVEWLNFLHPMVHHFKGRRWMDRPDKVVVHESVTSKWTTTIRVLTRRHLSILSLIHI